MLPWKATPLRSSDSPSHLLMPMVDVGPFGVSVMAAMVSRMQYEPFGFAFAYPRGDAGSSDRQVGASLQSLHGE